MVLDRLFGRSSPDPEPPAPPPEEATATIGAAEPDYSTAYPSAQNQLDLFAGQWTSDVPIEDTDSGPRRDLFADERITWALSVLGSVEGMSTLELGPLEGGHTFMLEQAGAQPILAIEAQHQAFLRCLVVKNLLDLDATFAYGDFIPYLRENDGVVDLMLASGVLYHMVDPVEALHLMATHSRRLVLWTHHYDQEVMDRRPDVAARFSGVETIDLDGHSYRVHRYEYRQGRQDSSFCGGVAPYSYWMERDDILGSLERWGFSEIEVGFDEPDRDHGPAFAVVAQR